MGAEGGLRVTGNLARQSYRLASGAASPEPLGDDGCSE